VEGKLKLNADGKEVTHLPLKVQADLHFDQRILSQSQHHTDVRLVRLFQSAQADIHLAKTPLKNSLRDTRRLIVVESDARRAVHFSPYGPLTREELDLVEFPASGLALESLLPPRPVKIGGQWPLDDATVARLLGLEAVSQQTVACTLEAVKEKVALITLEGKAAGAVGGVSSDIELKGKLNFDIGQRAVTWLTLACREDRAIGHAQPGFEVLTTLRMVTAPAQNAAELSERALAGLPLKADGGQTLLELTAPIASFQLSYDRRWQIMAQQRDVTVLRLVDRGDLIAQCNLSPLPTLGAGQQLTLEGFQDDVQRTLGQNFGQIVQAAEELGEGDIRILRVVASGAVGELPIQWMYYHLSDDHGHRTSAVFTIESSLVERFGHIDRELVAGFRFLPDERPTPATGAKRQGALR
jgi:hypothetical protein